MIFQTILLTTLASTAGLLAQEYVNLLNQYRTEAGEELSAARGKELFEKKEGEKSCTGCHGKDITKEGKEEYWILSKSIDPMALSANPEGFSDPEEVEKNFNKYCKKVFGKKCTAREKGDILLYFTKS